ncbi:hypothetical protein [Amphibacillus jilinensis]|uniref:hypothetical protein n=1 Tax=Amphibacillus jilinensis TaxID=1216008 RepID=UPI00036A7FF7|nr:hypothetical protein [Amphibacillus jilinensis]
MKHYLRFFLIFLLLIILSSCNNQLGLSGSEAPDFELSMATFNEDQIKTYVQDKDSMIIETAFWNEEREMLSDNDVFEASMELSSEPIELPPYEVELDNYYLDFDFTTAEDIPNYFIAFAVFEDGQQAYWQEEIPNGVFSYTAPHTGPGITKCLVILQWKNEDDMVLGQQKVKFNLNVLEKNNIS